MNDTWIHIRNTTYLDVSGINMHMFSAFIKNTPGINSLLDQVLTKTLQVV